MPGTVILEFWRGGEHYVFVRRGRTPRSLRGLVLDAVVRIPDTNDAASDAVAALKETPRVGVDGFPDVGTLDQVLAARRARAVAPRRAVR